ncbi:MAG TPA: XrtA system polysaccharide deacetylase [Solirubrobacteraceae bacterium]|nr:XrtA system polysaccharide deacetylase [Solirubrobacteraceae bacterium]
MPTQREPTCSERPLTKHHFTVDVEEYFQVAAFDRHVSRARWHELETRVARSVEHILELLERHRARGTFFVLGWVAERHPHVVRQISAAGHEVASHGWDHRRVTDQTQEQFRDSVRRTKDVLEHLTGVEIMGFRAPNFSIVPGREWALDILLEEGYSYDSSLYPIRRPGAGYPSCPRDPHWLERPSGWLAEIPPAVFRGLGMTLPAGGGAYFRVLPYALTRAALKACERRGVPGTFYIHPWELDPDQPRFIVPPWTRARHYGGLHRVRARLARLLSEFRFHAVADTVTAFRQRASPVA